MRVLSHPRGVPAVATPCRTAGFTLVELMITIAVAAVLLVIAVPSYNNIINSNRLTTAANAMVGALNTARMEAIKRNGSVQFCSNSAGSNDGSVSDTLSTACGTNSGAVFALTGTTATQVLAVPASLGNSVQVHGTIQAIRFNGQGLGFTPGATSAPYSGVVADVCSTALSSNSHIQISMTTGTIVTTTTSSTGTCP